MRTIYIVNATQVVTSEAHPEGAYSTVQGYPKTFDSNTYGDTDKALNAARADYYSRLSAIYTGSAARVMATVTLTRADGRQMLRESIGGFPEAEEAAEG
jgi:hypothetical protein